MFLQLRNSDKESLSNRSLSIRANFLHDPKEREKSRIRPHSALKLKLELLYPRSINYPQNLDLNEEEQSRAVEESKALIEDLHPPKLPDSGDPEVHSLLSEPFHRLGLQL